MVRAGKTSLRIRRVAASGQVLVSVKGEPARQEDYTDLSLGGMFVESLFPEEPGTLLNLDLQLQGLRLRVPAKVVWNRLVAASPGRPPGMGVRFAKLSPPQKKLLYNELSRELQRGHEVKSGTPPSPEDSDSDKGLRSLFSRLRGR